MSGSEYLLWSYGQFKKMTFFPPDPLILAIVGSEDNIGQEREKRSIIIVLKIVTVNGDFTVAGEQRQICS